MKTMMTRRFAPLFTVLLFAGTALAQRPQNPPPAQPQLNADNALLLHISYAVQMPGGDLSKRFGTNFDVGGGLEWMTAKGNWIIGIEGGYLFGSTVKTDVLANLRTPEGFIIGNDRSYADIQLRERGFHGTLLLGKLFSLPSPSVNARTGIRVTLGGGFLQHKIRIQDDPSRSVPQLSEEYKKGYDRLSNGFLLTQFIGYQYLGADRRANFFAGIECSQGFTQSRRDFNFDTRSTDTAKRLDLLFGIRIGWTLPFYLNSNPDKIYYY
ncbi:MAG: hypothetical protein HUU01_03670 [Saprospiraceae bacterium]|nr:hypothetical protein [Saprospiraceae bacterium]